MGTTKGRPSDGDQDFSIHWKLDLQSELVHAKCFYKIMAKQTTKKIVEILQQVGQDAGRCSPRYFSIWLFPVHLRLAHLLNNNSNKVSYI